MIQKAILLTKNNLETAVAPLNEHDTVEDFLESYGYMLEAHGAVVLCKEILDEEWTSVGYVVTESMFKANQPDIEINDKTYTYVRTV